VPIALSVTPASPAAANTTETLTATVGAAGSVQFTDGDTNIGAAVPVTGNVAATTTTLLPGVHTLTAVFINADPHFFSPFGSSTATVSYVVNAPTKATATTTTLRVFPNRAFQGLPVIFFANVAPRAAAGTVQFRDDTTALGAPVPVTAGFALTITTLPKGTHSLTAVFTPTAITAPGSTPSPTTVPTPTPAPTPPPVTSPGPTPPPTPTPPPVTSPGPTPPPTPTPAPTPTPITGPVTFAPSTSPPVSLTVNTLVWLQR
jgi:hypothetical protein